MVALTVSDETAQRFFLTKDIEEFLYHEADLLDDRKFEEWLELFTNDVCYFMPLRRNVRYGEWDSENTGEGREIAWFDEGKETLSQRVRQLATGQHWAEEPISRVSHLVSNVQVLNIEGNEVTVGSRFLVYRNRLEDETDLFIGRRTDILRRVDGRWNIARREIVLDQNVLLAKNLSIFF